MPKPMARRTTRKAGRDRKRPRLAETPIMTRQPKPRNRRRPRRSLNRPVNGRRNRAEIEYAPTMIPTAVGDPPRALTSLGSVGKYIDMDRKKASVDAHSMTKDRERMGLGRSVPGVA